MLEDNYAYHYLHRNLVRPAWNDGIFAPTQSHRESFMRWLRVHAKDRTEMTHRQAKLLDQYNVSFDFII